jgi:hypothetical protein
VLLSNNCSLPGSGSGKTSANARASCCLKLVAKGGRTRPTGAPPQCYGITCEHVRGRDFEWKQLVITNTKFGNRTARPKGFYLVSDPSGSAVDSDLLDIVVIEFSEDVDAEFFQGMAYVLDQGTVGTSKHGDALKVNGNLKGPTTIGEGGIRPVFALLEFTDSGASSFDPTLRKAVARFDNADVTSLTGISGAPVFDATTNRLAGVAVRGSMVDRDATMYYVDIFDVMKMIECVVNGGPYTEYKKVVTYLR